jgi:prepilin-type processing-associated H-X9-DG protein
LGEPDRGTDRRQPGGWIFNLLPYLDKGAERELGTTVVTQGSAAKWDMSRLTQVPLAIFTCPSRRPVALSAHRPGQPLRNAAWAPAVAKSDYAVCEGDFITNTPEGPLTLVEGDDPNYPWTDVSQATGVCFLRSEIRWVDIRDGTSETYLIGEKYVGRTNYDTHLDAGHDQCMYTGVDLDINRWTLEPPLPDMDFMSPRRFGSAHPGGCHFLFCDGSVRMMSYFIHRDVHRRLGNRRDGQPLTGAF